MGKSTVAVKAIITNDKNQILLLERNPEKNWDLPGGQIEEVENPKTALIREIKEELDLDIEILSEGKKWKFLRNWDKQWVTVTNFLCKIKSGKIKLSEEHFSYNWVDRSKIQKYSVKDPSFYSAI